MHPSSVAKQGGGKGEARGRQGGGKGEGRGKEGGGKGEGRGSKKTDLIKLLTLPKTYFTWTMQRATEHANTVDH